MSELKEHLFVPYSELQEGDELTDAFTIAKSYYLKSEADKVIAEKDAEIAELKAKLEDVNELIKTARQMLEDAKATHYAEMVGAGMRERRLRRALYKVCANWSHIAVAFFSSYVTKNRWRWMELKCLKKVEEYK